MDESAQLRKIIEERRAVYRLSLPLILCILAGLILSTYLAFAGPIFGLLVAAIFYSRLVTVARIPCPKCGEAFGTNSRLVLGVGAGSCQNCGLVLDDRLP